jgi:hypothetical protein
MEEEEKKMKTLQDEEEENYSDDEFIEDQTAKRDPQLQVIEEKSVEQTHDYSHFLEKEDHLLGESVEDASNAHIEQFLKTATAEDMDIIRESLSNFAEVSKNFTNFPPSAAKGVDPGEEVSEVIEEEEDLEEEIPEDNNEEGSSSEEHKFEAIHKESQQKQSKKGRPISAVYDLS